MGLLALKPAITPLLILTSSLAGRYWGEAVGGWLIGLPLTSGAVAFILALQQGPEFVARLSLGSLAGVLPLPFSSRMRRWHTAGLLHLTATRTP
jgi:hypothetical protein